MAFRPSRLPRVLGHERLPRPTNLIQYAGLPRQKYATVATSTTQTGQDHSNDENTHEVHLGLMADLRNHFDKVGVATGIGVFHALRQWYPDHIVVQTLKSEGLLEFAEAGKARADLDLSTEQYVTRYYENSSDWSSSDRFQGTGRLKDGIDLAKYDYEWKGRQMLLYAVDYHEHEYSHIHDHYILCPKKDAEIIKGRSRIVDELITAAALHENTACDEIWVYDRGYWKKSHKLWQAVQASHWEYVVLKSETKAQLVDDVEGFFDRKEDYASFAVPWKRGIILHGLPGNGKTISIKALMRSLALRSPAVPTLYVKSLGIGSSVEDIRKIFEKAREIAPCLLVLEDLDSLVSDKLKSFFLNEVDGLEGNDGIMIIGTTNYLDRLDAGISKRPSRFDRKYHFALPATSERARYCDYWRSKLSKNSALKLPVNISTAVAEITEGFSFAYLQETFVTALLSIVQTQKADTTILSGSHSTSIELESSNIWQAIKKQVEILRKEMRDSKKSVEDSGKNSMLSEPRSSSAASTGFGLGR